jgi:hypothetical protein
MAKNEPLRITLLCEDRMQEQFFAAICEEEGWQVVDRRVAPKGIRSAEQWVREQLPTWVLQYRKWRRENRGLMVGIDGDKVGVPGRRDSLNARLRGQGQAAMDPGEAIALMVPTWSIETWILYLHHGELVLESEQSKDLLPARLRAQEHGTLTRQAMRDVQSAWSRREVHPDLPSLEAGWAECRRLKLLRAPA